MSAASLNPFACIFRIIVNAWESQTQMYEYIDRRDSEPSLHMCFSSFFFLGATIRRKRNRIDNFALRVFDVRTCAHKVVQQKWKSTHNDRTTHHVTRNQSNWLLYDINAIGSSFDIFQCSNFDCKKKRRPLSVWTNILSIKKNRIFLHLTGFHSVFTCLVCLLEMCWLA